MEHHFILTLYDLQVRGLLWKGKSIFIKDCSGIFTFILVHNQLIKYVTHKMSCHCIQDAAAQINQFCILKVQSKQNFMSVTNRELVMWTYFDKGVKIDPFLIEGKKHSRLMVLGLDLRLQLSYRKWLYTVEGKIRAFGQN